MNSKLRKWAADQFLLDAFCGGYRRQECEDLATKDLIDLEHWGIDISCAMMWAADCPKLPSNHGNLYLEVLDYEAFYIT